MYIGEIEITKREVLASITIIAIMIMLGIFISSKISESQLDKADEYNKAVKIENNKDLFQYGIDTSVGNALVYGNLTYVDGVSYPDIKDKYIYIKKVTERYTRYTRTVKSGKTTTTQVYHTWDEIDSETKMCKNIKFCGVELCSEVMGECIQYAKHIKTVRIGFSKIRYVYYGYKGSKVTSYCSLKNKTMKNKQLYNNTTIKEVMDIVDSPDVTIVLFWITWIVVTGGIVYRFCAFENRWLE